MSPVGVCVSRESSAISTRAGQQLLHHQPISSWFFVHVSLPTCFQWTRWLVIPVLAGHCDSAYQFNPKRDNLPEIAKVDATRNVKNHHLYARISKLLRRIPALSLALLTQLILVRLLTSIFPCYDHRSFLGFFQWSYNCFISPLCMCVRQQLPDRFIPSFPA